MNEWRNPMDMVVAEAESRLAAVKASYEAQLAARDAEWRAAVGRLRSDPLTVHCNPLSILDALLAAMEVPHDGQ